MRRYPRIPHLHGSVVRPDDLCLSPAETLAFLRRPVRVQEKLDGLNVGLRCLGPGRPRVLSRVLGAMPPERLGDGLEPLAAFVARLSTGLWRGLGTRYVVFGEWLLVRAGADYQTLPDAFMAFDVFDTRHARFLPLAAAARVAEAAGLTFNHPVFVGTIDTDWLARSSETSRFGPGPAEGFVLTGTPGRAKWVRASHRRDATPSPTTAARALAHDSPQRAERLRL